MTRILFVVNHAGYFLSHRLPLALAAKEAGYDVVIATPRSRHVPQITDAGLAWEEIPLRRSSRNPFTELRTIQALVALYRLAKPDIVHHVTVKPVLYGTLAARLAKVPAVVNAVAGLGHVFVTDDALHRLLRRLIGVGYRAVIRHPRMKVIFQNEDDRSMFVASRMVRGEDTVLIAGSGVDPERFRPGRGGGDVPAVVFASRMLWSKGLDEFLTAAEILNAQNVRARFLLVGEPDPDNPASATSAELQERAARAGAELLGRRSDMPEIFANADIACLPSHREGLPKVLVEAASAGLAVVTTDVPGCRHVVRHEENGLLVPVRDPNALASALRTLIEDAPLRRKMGERGRQRVLDEFSLRGVIEATLKVYRELAA